LRNLVTCGVVISPSVLLYLVRFYSEHHQFLNALRIYREMTINELTLEIYSTMIPIFYHVQDYISATSFFTEMLEHGFTPSNSLYTYMIDIAITEKNLFRAYQLLDDARKHNRPETHMYNAIMVAEKNPDNVLILFNNMILNHVEPNLDSFALLMEIFLQRSEEKAIEVYEEAVRKRGIFPGIETCSALMEMWGKVGNVEQVKKLIKDLKEHDMEPKQETMHMLRELRVLL